MSSETKAGIGAWPCLSTNSSYLLQASGKYKLMVTMAHTGLHGVVCCGVLWAWGAWYASGLWETFCRILMSTGSEKGDVGTKVGGGLSITGNGNRSWLRLGISKQRMSNSGVLEVARQNCLSVRALVWGELEARSSPGTWVLGLDLRKTPMMETVSESGDITVGTSTRASWEEESL